MFFPAKSKVGKVGSLSRKSRIFKSESRIFKSESRIFKSEKSDSEVGKSDCEVGKVGFWSRKSRILKSESRILKSEKSGSEVGKVGFWSFWAISQTGSIRLVAPARGWNKVRLLLCRGGLEDRAKAFKKYWQNSQFMYLDKSSESWFSVSGILKTQCRWDGKVSRLAVLEC